MNSQVTICVPVYGRMPGLSAMSIATVTAVAVQQGLCEGIHHCQQTLVDKARNTLVTNFLKTPATHMLFADADMILPPDTVSRLLDRNVDVVSGLYFNRTDFKPVVYQWPHNQITSYTPGMQKVGFVGMGCCLIRRTVFERMHDQFKDHRWFLLRDGAGEDTWFCDRCRQLGIDVWLDADCKCGHVAEVVVDEATYQSSLKAKE